MADARLSAMGHGANRGGELTVRSCTAADSGLWYSCIKLGTATDRPDPAILVTKFAREAVMIAQRFSQTGQRSGSRSS
jgi:hypothetical protein